MNTTDSRSHVCFYATSFGKVDFHVAHNYATADVILQALTEAVDTAVGGRFSDTWSETLTRDMHGLSLYDELALIIHRACLGEPSLVQSDTMRVFTSLFHAVDGTPCTLANWNLEYDPSYMGHLIGADDSIAVNDRPVFSSGYAHQSVVEQRRQVMRTMLNSHDPRVYIGRLCVAYATLDDLVEKRSSLVIVNRASRSQSTSVQQISDRLRSLYESLYLLDIAFYAVQGWRSTKCSRQFDEGSCVYRVVRERYTLPAMRGLRTLISVLIASHHDTVRYARVLEQIVALTRTILRSMVIAQVAVAVNVSRTGYNPYAWGSLGVTTSQVLKSLSKQTAQFFGCHWRSLEVFR